MWAILLLWDFRRENTPPDMVEVLCVDSSGALTETTIPRLVYRKWGEDIRTFADNNKTYVALVDITLTDKGISHTVPVPITSDEAMVLERIVDLAFNHRGSIPKEGKIPKEMRWVTSRIINTGLKYAELNKDYLLGIEKAITGNISPDVLRDLEKRGIFASELTSAPISWPVVCPNCRSLCAPDQRFCKSCGARLSTGCPYCGTVINPGNRFCPNCGARLA